MTGWPLSWQLGAALLAGGVGAVLFTLLLAAVCEHSNHERALPPRADRTGRPIWRGRA